MGASAMKLLRAGGPEQCTSVLGKLHRSLIHEEKEKGELEKQLCCLWLPPPVAAQQQPEDNNAAPNSVPSCLDLHEEIWVLRREQSVTFLPEC